MIRSIATGRIVTVDSVGGGCPYLMRDDIFFRLVCNSGFEWIFDVFAESLHVTKSTL